MVSRFTIREQNESLVLKEIVDQNEISRSELSQRTSINKTTISEIVKKLLEDKLILETRVGKSSSQGGRRPVLLTLNRNAGFIISIDVGAFYVKAILTNLTGEVINRYKIKDKINKINILEHIRLTIDTLEKYIPKTEYGIVGTSIGIHGVVNNEEIVFTPAYNLDQLSLKQELEEAYDWPIYIANEANLAALGEYTFGTMHENLVSISSHTGIGAGVVNNGKLYTGNNGKTGEIGHMTIFPNGKQCPCGNKGCLELYASNQALYRNISKSLNIDIETIDTDKIEELLKKNTNQLKPILENFTSLLAIGIHNVVLLYDPELIIMNSSVLQKIPDLLIDIKNEINSRFSENIKIINSELDGNSILLGGVTMVAQGFMNIKKLKFNTFL